MELQERLSADLKEAMLARDSRVVSTLRLLQSELKNARIQSGADLDEPQTLQVIRREVKKRTEAAEAYRKAQSPERAAEEEAEAAVLQKYLPAQIERSQVEAYVREQAPSFTPAQKGDLIRQTLAHFQGQTDGRTVSELVATYLS